MKTRTLTALLAVLASALPLQGATAAASDTVVIAQGVDASTLDPIKFSITADTNVQCQMFDPLAKRDASGKLAPALATAWKRISPTTWQFKLRRDVRFWNGDPFTSADVKFTVEKILDPAYHSQQDTRVDTVARVETPDPYTALLVTKKPTPLPPAITRQIFIVDSKYWLAHGDQYMVEHPMGTGAYTFKEWVKDDHVAMDANPAYWGGEPAIKHVVFKPIPDSAARVSALRAGDVDLITNVPFQYALILTGGRNTRMTSARSDRILYVAFNLRQPGPQNDRAVRQALNYALDVPLLIKSVLGGRAYEDPEPIPPNYFGYDPSIKPYPHDLAKAKTLLAQAGYPDGKGLNLVLNGPIGRYAGDKDLLQAIAGQLGATGAQVTARPQEWTSYIQQANHRALSNLFMLGWGNITFDADNTLASQLVSSGLTSTYHDADVDRWTEEAKYELDVKKREAIYHRVFRKIHEDAPWLFLFQYEDLYATSKRLDWNARSDEYLYCTEMKLRG
ncbi:MAG: hypothetical protein JO101_07685 [Candidatus Eremiobacteraeota bacterium]|nr:hypothetical protein [Candidatus Eremiobacteraeota bacterium]MBV8355183.1 hypothetical protein [Candidatus Eremiobacteraeota bacterium]